MANPSGRTYRFAEHQPLSEPGGTIHAVYHEGRPGGSESESAAAAPVQNIWEAARQKAEEWLRGLGPLTQDAWNRMEKLAGRAPLITLAAGLTLGLLTGRCLAHGKTNT